MARSRFSPSSSSEVKESVLKMWHLNLSEPFLRWQLSAHWYAETADDKDAASACLPACLVASICQANAVAQFSSSPPAKRHKTADLFWRQGWILQVKRSNNLICSQNSHEQTIVRGIHSAHKDFYSVLTNFKKLYEKSVSHKMAACHQLQRLITFTVFKVLTINSEKPWSFRDTFLAVIFLFFHLQLTIKNKFLIYPMIFFLLLWVSLETISQTPITF